MEELEVRPVRCAWWRLAFFLGLQVVVLGVALITWTVAKEIAAQDRELFATFVALLVVAVLLLRLVDAWLRFSWRWLRAWWFQYNRRAGRQPLDG